MLDVLYIYSSYSNITYLEACPSTHRVMYDILQNQKELNVEYSDIPLKINLAFYDYSKQVPSIDWTVFHKHFCDNIVKEINHEYILLTLQNPWEIYFLSVLLNAKKKVIVGGPFLKNYDLKTIRKIFKSNGCKNLDNVLIIRSYLTKDVNLYKMIQNWKDVDLSFDVDTTNLYLTDSPYDFYVDHLPLLRKKGFKLDKLPILLNSYCNWNKCTFCQYKTIKPMNFISNENAEKIANHTVEVGKQYGIKHINISNPEFYFTEPNKKFLDVMEKNNFIVDFFTSVREMKKEKYWENIKKYNKVIKYVIIGVETFDDFTLKEIKKGSTYIDTFKVVNKIIEFNKDKSNYDKVGIVFLMIADLITNNKNSVIQNYNRAFLLKHKLKNSNTPFSFSYTNYIAYPLTEYCNSEYVNIVGEPLKTMGDYNRIDENGNILPPDKEIVDPVIFNNMMEDFRWGG